MRVRIDNRTGLLNDYYFQTLCLLYFPGEKFSEKDESPAWAEFLLEKREDGTFFCSAVLSDGNRTGKADLSSEGVVPAVPMDETGLAALTLGNAYLRAGEKLFGFSLPWGYLLGLRPVKRAKYYLDLGYAPETVERMFREDYRTHPDKASLAVETAAVEQGMLRDAGDNDCGLYISIPFCPTRCAYCSFISVAATERMKEIAPVYLERLKEEIAAVCGLIRDTGMRLTSVYIGGGTPTSLTDRQTEDLLRALDRVLPRNHLKEFTCEAGRPDTITKNKIRLLESVGVDRISVNPQTTDDAVLRRIGRNHTSADFFRAADLAMGANFRVRNADLIAGLPGDTEDGFRKSLEDVLSFGFENVTVHTLTVKKSSFIRFWEEGYYDPLGTAARSCVSYARTRLKESGRPPYYLYRQKNIVGNAENVGYALPGTENLYNVLMMEEYATVFACGAGAITKLVTPDRKGILRIANPKYPFEYLNLETIRVPTPDEVTAFRSGRVANGGDGEKENDLP
ncbi:MAG: coproporphyrinogen dehydrogenase HemZ [Clostridia bacterium]|nr:coproporphyrinogen dehydrogenase HemZ [Clostridia bacterium]